MIVKYAPDFKILYEKLPLAAQRQFLSVDSRACAGDLSGFRRQGWMYVANVGIEHAAFGTLRSDDTVFYWIFIGSKGDIPVIL